MKPATPGTTPGHARLFNRRVVLEAIRLRGPISRADIARQTGLSLQTISNIAEELSGEGLLREAARHSGGRGAPPRDLALDPDGGFTVGVSLDHRRLVVMLVDLTGQIRAEAEQAIEHLAPEAVIRAIHQTEQTLIREIGADRSRVWGAGVAMPMIFEDGRPVAFGPTSLPDWVGVPVADRLSRRLGVPVFVENDATAAAVGEQLYGAGRRLRDFFYVYVGVGVGGGMILSGHPYRGSTGRAGELGHIVVEPGGRPCACGNRGCLERYVSLSAAQQWLDGLPEGDRPVDPQVLAAQADALDPWIEQAARRLSTACVTIENLLDPEAVVIGGAIPDNLLTRLVARLTALRSGRVPILKAEVDLETPALGGAALPLFAGLAPIPSLLGG